MSFSASLDSTDQFVEPVVRVGGADGGGDHNSGVNLVHLNQINQIIL